MSSSAFSSSSSSTRKMLTLKSLGGEVFEVEVPAIVSQSDIIATMVGEGQVGSAIPLPDYISSETLSKVVEYCNKHHASGLDKKDIQEWDAKFFDMGSYDSLFDLVMAADFLGMKSLMDLCCEAVANMIKGKSLQEFCPGNFHVGTTSNPGKDQKEI